jgi:conjugal transfer pilus assembly protein TraD
VSLAPLDPPPAQRSLLRRHVRWLVPVAALAVAPLPLAVLGVAVLAGGWTAAKLITASRRRARERRELSDPERIQLGRDEHGRPLSLHVDQLGAHALILGASGSGKTTTMLAITNQQILRGRPVVAIDLKGSPDFAAQLQGAAAAAGRPFRVWSPDGPEQWNPLAHGNATELKDKLISTERFTEPHYRRAAERYVQTALQVLKEARPGREPGLAEVVELLEPARLRKMAARLAPDRNARVQQYVMSLGPDQLSAVRGLQSRLAIVTESHTGAFLEPRAGAIDLRRALEGPEVVLFSLNSSTYGQLSAQLGTLAVQDLVSAAGARERDGVATSARPGSGRPLTATVAIDEFSALGADHVLALIARGRSAGVSVLVATQELADLDRVSRGFRQQVIGSTAVKIAHRQDVTESALEVARLTGTERVWERSYSAPTGLGGVGSSQRRVTSREVERLRVDPTTVQSLGTGEAVVITKLPRSETRLARIRPLGIGPATSERGRGRVREQGR